MSYTSGTIGHIQDHQSHEERGRRSAESSEEGLTLPSCLPFKILQAAQRYPKGQARGRHWKHLKQILQGESYQSLPADETSYVSIDTPPSTYPAKKYCDITGFEAPYVDPRTKLRFANVDVFRMVRVLPEPYLHGYLHFRDAVVVLK